MTEKALEAGWKDRLSCFSPNFIEHEVGTQTLKFYPVSVGMAFKLRTIGKPIARSLSILFSNTDRDVGTKDSEVTNEDGSKDRQIEILPISDGLAKIRHEQRIDAIDGIVTALTEEKNAEVVAQIIMDSLCEVFPKDDKKKWPPALEFINSMPVPVLGAMIMGIIQANKDVFGPLADKVTEAAQNAVARFKVEEKPVEEKEKGTVTALKTSG